MEEQIEIEHSPPEPEKEKASFSAGTAVLFGVGVVIAFAIGLAVGFVARPLAINDVPVQVVVTVVPPPVQEVAQAANPTPAPTEEEASPPTEEPTEESPPLPDPTDDPNATPTPTVMEYVLSDARHIQGSEGAPVTVVEFSDFK